MANKQEKRLLLYAEMKLPGEAWLEFRIDNEDVLHQTTTWISRQVILVFHNAFSCFYFQRDDTGYLLNKEVTSLCYYVL